jgi:enoyl-CoA hydratase/carnithine racemase
MDEAFTTLEVEVADAVFRVRFARVDQLNALDDTMADELATVFGELIPASDAKVVVVSGGGGAFMAGADLDRLEKWAGQPAAAVEEDLKTGFSAGMIESVGIPVIAAVDGVAFGIGFDIALAADAVIASERAVFALPEVDVGVVPLGGSTRILAQRIGLARATRVVVFGERVPAERALEWGLVTTVVPPDGLDAAVDDLARKVLRRSPVAMKAAKRLLRSTPSMSAAAAADAERQEFLECLAGPDVAEGIAAVRERRRPTFGGAA